MSINWGNSNVKDVYWGYTPVKEVWYGSNKVRSRVTYYNKTISVDPSSTPINDTIPVLSGNYEFTIKAAEDIFIKFSLQLSSALTLNFHAYYDTSSSTTKNYSRKHFMLNNANSTSSEDLEILHLTLEREKSKFGHNTDFNHWPWTNTSYYTASILNDTIYTSVSMAYGASAYEILLQRV